MMVMARLDGTRPAHDPPERHQRESGMSRQPLLRLLVIPGSLGGV